MSAMDPFSETGWERRLAEAAGQFAYPPTPDIAGEVNRRLQAAPMRPGVGSRSRSRRLAWATAWATALALLLFAALAAPPVRAQIVEFFQAGVIRIFTGPPSPTPEDEARPAPTLIPSLLDLGGRTSLDEARDQVDFPVRLPSYPPGLGEPDLVLVQRLGDEMLVLIWLDPALPGQVALSLHAFGPRSFAGEKTEPTLIEQTEVNGKPAVWVVGPYVMRLVNGDLDIRRLVDGNVLIWQEGEITYRLESTLPLEEAVRAAESLEER